MIVAPVQIPPNSPHLQEVLDLIRRSFAYMDGRIDPPSSMHHLTLDALAAQAEAGEVWAIGAPVVASVVLTPRADVLYLGKLAVSEDQRGQGLARHLIEHAVRRARALGLSAVELQTRVELVENHVTFARLGFTRSGTTAHAGYERPTSVTMRREVC
ncbi:GNAT family N-acetyltransferase [Tritonibacter mobilis]|uniref:Acetyltransferase n=1 Tax=Tritonibacter mobilis F1926 TaxID=1265309 RepID=A0A1B1A0G6_9RHOB|nr:GNAT family N-acetyltransferase [Tritonibacter mobilis]ANP39988.1 acetyltransferase [Tritonibacter mobilis F1926]KJZ23816.1 acetyltransferase [Tritonibacter mobilis]